MNNNKSKYISLLLRHKPENANLTLDDEGWCDVSQLCTNIDITFEELEEIVDTNNKKRFAFNADKTKIRASQGHSLEVDLKMPAIQPPRILYHGAKLKDMPSIHKTGLQKMNRQHVHLTDDIDTAKNVANRRPGESVILKINSGLMYFNGDKFFKSENGVWLTDNVPIKYINVL